MKFSLQILLYSLQLIAPKKAYYNTRYFSQYDETFIVIANRGKGEEFFQSIDGMQSYKRTITIFQEQAE